MKFNRLMFSLVAIFVLMFFLSGCSKNKPFIVFSSDAVTQETSPEYKFKTQERIHYAIVHPKGFDDKVVKVQIFKKDDKSEFGGYSYVYNRTCELKNDNYYRDYIVMHDAGIYVMQIFYLSNLQKPIALANFWVF